MQFFGNEVTGRHRLPGDAARRTVAVSLQYSFEHQSFMILRCGDEPWTHDELAGFGELLDRVEVIGTDLAPRVFSIVDDIWQTDPYVREFVASAELPSE